MVAAVAAGQTGPAARRLASGRVRVLDVGTVTCTDGGAERTRYFVNIAEAGLGARWWPGRPAWAGSSAAPATPAASL